MTKSKEDWEKILSETEYNVLRNEGTERAYTSGLNEEKREGNYYCIGCNNKLFSSKMKFDSGTGWPSSARKPPAAWNRCILPLSLFELRSNPVWQEVLGFCFI